MGTGTHSYYTAVHTGASGQSVERDEERGLRADLRGGPKRNTVYPPTPTTHPPGVAWAGFVGTWDGKTRGKVDAVSAEPGAGAATFDDAASRSNYINFSRVALFFPGPPCFLTPPSNLVYATWVFRNLPPRTCTSLQSEALQAHPPSVRAQPPTPSLTADELHGHRCKDRQDGPTPPHDRDMDTPRSHLHGAVRR